jgi:hypothetical protein
MKKLRLVNGNASLGMKKAGGRDGVLCACLRVLGPEDWGWSLRSRKAEFPIGNLCILRKSGSRLA